MYLKKTKSRGKEYYQVVETYPDGKGEYKQRVVEHLGSLQKMILHKRMATGKTLLSEEK